MFHVRFALILSKVAGVTTFFRNFAKIYTIMGKLVINSYDEFAAYDGKELGCSDWLLVDQDRINLFADATLDHQWIHVDTERAAKESPYKSTIAHGYLTLSLLPYLWQQIIEVNNIKMLVNYGMDKMRFGQPVVTGSRVRMKTKLHSIQNLRGICKVEVEFSIEIEGQRKPALEGISTFLYYFK
jgi:acyl dehydratase